MPRAGRDAAAGADRLKVFISYSRRDCLEFADQLDAALQACGFETLIDRHRISGGEDWKLRLGRLILECDTVVFVLSPESAVSEICNWEVEEARRLAKRILPVIALPLGSSRPPEHLASLNYMHFYAEPQVPGSGFGQGLGRLARALEADLEWLREHTRLLGLAAGWEERGRPESRLLTGADIAEAKAWLARQPRAAPDPTPLQVELIRASEAAETARADAARAALAERERLLEAAEAAAREREAAAEAAAAAQAERQTLLGRAETAARETARSQRRFGRLLWAVAALTLVLFAAAMRQSLETERREQAVFTSLAAQAMAEERYDRAMRYALMGYPPPGALPWSPFSTALEARLAGSALLTRIAASMLGHKGGITSASFSADGRRLVTGGWDGTARIWDVASGRAIAVVQADDSGVQAASFSPDGGRLLAAGWRGMAVWQADGKERIQRPGSSEPLAYAEAQFNSSASFSADGKRIVAISVADRGARIWDAGNGGKPIARLGTSAVVAVFSPDGRRVATGHPDKTARLWDAATGQPIGAAMVHGGAVQAIAWSLDNARIATGSEDGRVRLWDAGSGQETTFTASHAGALTAIAFSRDGRRLITASLDHSARIWSVDGSRPPAVLSHTGPVRAASFSPDGKLALTASEDHSARLWDAADGSLVAVLKGHTAALSTASFSPDGRSVVTASLDGAAHVWDLARVREQLLLSVVEVKARPAPPKDVILISEEVAAHFTRVRAVSFDRSGGRILTASDAGARIWDATSGAQLLDVPLRGANDASFSADGMRAVAALSDRTAVVWDAASGRSISRLTGHSGEVWAASFSSDGTLLVTSDGHAARIWDASSARVVATEPFTGKRHPMRSVAELGRDGTRMLLADESAIRIFGFARRGREAADAPVELQRLLELKPHGLGSFASFAPDGSRVISGGFGDRSARIWDAARGTELHQLKGHRNRLRAGAFSPDGRRVLTAADDLTVRLWDAASGTEIAAWEAHAGGVYAAAWHPGGQRIVSGGGDGMARVWDTRWAMVYGAELRQRVCAERLVGNQELTDAELADPVLARIDRSDRAARNPCLRRGPLTLDYWARLAGWVWRLIGARPQGTG